MDLDGTLLGPDGLTSRRNRVALGAARGHGVAVTLATGRRFCATLPYAQEPGLSVPFICCQGATVAASRMGGIRQHQPKPLTLADAAMGSVAGDGVEQA